MLTNMSQAGVDLALVIRSGMNWWNMAKIH